MDLWESEEVFGQYVQERLMPAPQRVGVQVPEDTRAANLTVDWSVSVFREYA